MIDVQIETFKMIRKVGKVSLTLMHTYTSTETDLDALRITKC